ncbi:MAG: 3-deoxy-D-manno-octulosonic acid transferase [Paracoccaceae bacterium]|uniref:3-deoxy-D-manno-octulosonic acid transferase n=1 Tax=Seohaeicola saemankumensis TaxID=481181 RepID=UPI001E606743|nr:glycosyltransferase N-terminal domain-containing protein [Seohaeicola saemankumensis]MCD1626419.1 3-deoxy-D-manno-octulosonic acid transferase [Seohaeicola saemankumensis]
MTGGTTPAPPQGLTAVLRLYMWATALAPSLLGNMARKGHLAQGADATRLAERFGHATVPRPAGRLIWINAASVGEVASSLDLARDLEAATGARLLFTTTTATGAETLARRLRQAIHQFQPVDTPTAVRAFLDHWKPDLACFMENDLWPRLMVETGKRQIPMAVINARASKTRTRAPRAMRALLSRAALISTQDAVTARQILNLGLDPARIIDTGDLKAAASPLPVDQDALHAMQNATRKRPVWVAASTHPGDETAVLAAHQATLRAHPDLLLILIPRHPARGAEIADMIHSAGLQSARRSQGGLPATQDQVYLADTLGETGLFYSLGPLVFLAGSFGDEGGHNPYEPATLGAAVLHGPRIANFKLAYAKLTQAGAAQQVRDADDLGARVASLIGSAQLEEMGKAACNLSNATDEARHTLLARLVPMLR